MLPFELNTDISKSSNDTEKLTLNLRKPNLALCKELIFSCSKNIELFNVNNLSEESMNFKARPSCSKDLKSTASAFSKKSASFGKNDIRYIECSHKNCNKSKKPCKHSDSLERNDLSEKSMNFSALPCCSKNLRSIASAFPKKTVSFGKNDIRYFEYSHKNCNKSKKPRKHSDSLEKSSLNDTCSASQNVSTNRSSKRLSKKHSLKEKSKKLSYNNILFQRKELNGTIKHASTKNYQKQFKRLKENTLSKKKSKKLLKPSYSKILVPKKELNKTIKHASTKNYKKNFKRLRAKLKNDINGEKLLNILKKTKVHCANPSIDKHLNLIVCLLSMLVYNKCHDSLLNLSFKNISDKNLIEVDNSHEQELSLLRKRVSLVKEKLKILSTPKCNKEKKYLRVCLKKLPDCIFNHIKNQNGCDFPKLLDYMCDGCLTPDVSVVVSKLPDKILQICAKDKPIMISNLPQYIL